MVKELKIRIYCIRWRNFLNLLGVMHPEPCTLCSMLLKILILRKLYKKFSTPKLKVTRQIFFLFT